MLHFRELVKRLAPRCWAHPSLNVALVIIMALVVLVPCDAAQGQSLRETFLFSASDSIREGRYDWAEGALTTLVRQDPSDWEAASLLAVALAATGDFVRARDLASSLLGIPEAEGVAPIVDGAISDFEAAGRFRNEFIAALQAADVPAAHAAIGTSAMNDQQAALARSVLCVLTGDRSCFLNAVIDLPADGPAALVRDALSQQLAAAEHQARVYGIALAQYVGVDTLIQRNDPLVVAERAAHVDCGSPPGWLSLRPVEKLIELQGCWRGQVSRLVQSATLLVEAAPLSRTGLDAALVVALLAEPVASVDSAAVRMKRAAGVVDWPLWQQHEKSSPGAFNLKQGSTPMTLRVTETDVMLFESSFAGERLIPLSSGLDETPNGSIPSGALRWQVSISDLKATTGRRLRQPLGWDGNDEAGRWLKANNGSIELVTSDRKRYEVPYPMMVYHFSRAYGEMPTRSVMRSFGSVLGSQLTLDSTQVELADSVRTGGFLGKMLTGVMIGVSVASLAAGDLETALEGLTTAGTWMEEEAARSASAAAERSAWIRATTENQLLQEAFNQSVNNQWVVHLLEQLPLLKGGDESTSETFFQPLNPDPLPDAPSHLAARRPACTILGRTRDVTPRPQFAAVRSLRMTAHSL